MRLTVFDLDHTLLTTNSSFRFGVFLYRQNVFSFWTLLDCLIYYARHKWLGMSIYDLHTKVFARLFKGQFLEDICHYANQFLTESLTTMLYEPVVKRLRTAQDKGDHVLILSSSPDFLVKKIAEHLGVLHWKATVYQCDEKGKFITISKVMEGQDKANYIHNLSIQMCINRSVITVYSDSYLDLPILKMAGKPIAVGPDYRLKYICLQNGWEIL